MRNYPWYKGWNEEFAKKGVTIIGVHTPESEGEHDISKVLKKAKQNGLDYPIVIDNDKKIWNDWGNRWWPSTYLIDKNGYVRYRWDGELNWKSVRGEVIMRKKIEELLAEPGPKRTEAKKPPNTKETAEPKKRNEPKKNGPKGASHKRVPDPLALSPNEPAVLDLRFLVSQFAQNPEV